MRRISGAKSAQKVTVRPNLNHLAASNAAQQQHSSFQMHPQNKDLSYNYKTGGTNHNNESSSIISGGQNNNFFERGSASAMMTSKSLATHHRMRHQSLNLAKGALKSIGNQETQA